METDPAGKTSFRAGLKSALEFEGPVRSGLFAFLGRTEDRTGLKFRKKNKTETGPL